LKIISIWWHGLFEDLRLACENELYILEEPVRRNIHGLISPNTNLPTGWRCLSTESLIQGNDMIICDSFKCLYDSPEHESIRSRYRVKKFQRCLGFLHPVILTLSGLIGLVSLIKNCIK